MSSPNKIVLITGANSGIGYATTLVIVSASEEYHVIMAGRRIDKLNAAMAALKATDGVKGSLSTVKLDVTDKKSVIAARDEIANNFGRVDVLMNNAGILSHRTSVAEQFEEVFRTNVTGPIFVTETFRDLLLKSKSPYSIYTSSGLGSLAMAADPDHPWFTVEDTAYRASKSALNMMVLQEAKAVGKAGIKTFPICPGLVVSNLRGTSEEARSGGGYAGDPKESGELVLSIIQGMRDSDVGKFVHKDGIYPW